MALGVQLTPEQSSLRDEIRSLLSEIRKDIGPGNVGTPSSFEESANKLAHLSKKAHNLHMQLKASGNEPVHHRYMIKNRGMAADDPEFYYHIHPVEDLLDYIDNIHANDDPEDQTINHEFEFRVFSRRWGHDDVYDIRRTKGGWEIGFHYEYDCDKSGSSGLYELLDHDSINYPEELPGYFAWLWKQAAEQGLSHEDVQLALKQLADWVSLCEKNTPKGLFRDWK
jgi:hypothetical protein